MGICQTTIILRHMWLVEHNPKIDWSTGRVSMTRCPVTCGSKATADDTNQLKFSSASCSAGNLTSSPRAKLCWKVHIEEVPEGQSGPNETEPPLGFAHPD